MTPEENIKKLNIKLPLANAPAGNYVATKITGKMLFVSGQISINESGELIVIDIPRSYKYKKKSFYL